VRDLNERTRACADVCYDTWISQIVVLKKKKETNTQRGRRSSCPRGSYEAEPDSNSPRHTWRWSNVRDLNERTRACADVCYDTGLVRILTVAPSQVT
jgi:hypothetical protein